MKHDNISHSTYSIFSSVPLSFFLLLLATLLHQGFGCQSNSINTTEQKTKPTFEKQKGAHVFGSIDSTNLQSIKQNNYNWVTLVSWASQKDFDSPDLAYFRGDSLDRIRRDSIWKYEIACARSYGFKIFMKPHIWINEPTAGTWRSEVFPTDENNWQQWKKSYRAFILHYAEIAEKNKVELFSVGTELTRLSQEKSDFWRALIKEVRSIYSGEITYAANWYQEYEQVNFWEELDYIGIQAYFPLVKNETPTVTEISKGWEQYLPTIKTLHKKYNKKILFTELGYKSTSDSAIEPWTWAENAPEEKLTLSLETQANCYQAFFDTVWEEDWFAGVQIWQLRSGFNGLNKWNDKDFTPQGKPAEEVISKGFK